MIDKMTDGRTFPATLSEGKIRELHDERRLAGMRTVWHEPAVRHDADDDPRKLKSDSSQQRNEVGR